MRDSMIIYTAYADKFKKLSNAQFGLLIRAMMEYQQTGTEPDIEDSTVALAFDVVKYDLDKNTEKYDSITQRNQENGKKGGRPKTQAVEEEPNGLSEKPKKPTGLSENPSEPKKADNDNDNVNDNDIRKEKSKRERFIPPTVDEVRSYCAERKNGVDPQHFVDFYASKGWKVGNQPMKDWKACVRTWESRSKPPEKKNPFMQRESYLDDLERLAICGE